MGQYLDSVREVERRIQKAEQKGAEELPDVTRPLTAPASWEEHVKLMYDLQVLAMQADITRVITFQMSREVSTRTYPQIGVQRHITRHRITAATRRSSRSWRRSTDTTSLCSRITSRSSRPLRMATDRCWIIP